MFISVLGEDEEVIQVHEDTPIQHVTECVTDKGLENSRDVSDSERHNKVLKVAKRKPSSTHFLP